MKAFVMVYCDGISYDVGILEEVSNFLSSLPPTFNHKN